MEIRQLIQVGLWTKLLGIYYKRNSYTDEADFLGILPISAMTNIRNLFSQAIRRYPFTAKQKTWRKE
jgi:hypothetical protein